jgi:glutathionylspermidine synthase
VPWPTAQEAGYRVKFLPIQEIGWDEGRNLFVDLDGEPIRILFKLYPWEWIMREDFGANVKPSGALFLEPRWKMLLANKGLLPILWDVLPAHENLLPAYREPEPLGNAAVVATKPGGTDFAERLTIAEEQRARVRRILSASGVGIWPS